MSDLSTQYLGLKLRNPLIVASSGLTRNARSIRLCEQAGVGALVMKSIFEEDIRRKDTTFKDPLMLHPEAVDYFDAQVGMLYGPSEYCEEIRQAKEETSIPVIASVNCTESRWWTEFASQLEAAGADAIELNLSVPLVELEVSGEESEARFYEIVSKIRSQVKIPLSVKLSGQLTCPQNVASRLVQAGADGLVVFNRQSGLDIDITSRRAFSSKGDQGLSTPAGFFYPLRWVAILHELLPDVSLAASGGVHNGDAFIKYILAGASAVQVCSLFYRKGLNQAAVLIGALENYLGQQGVDSVEKIRGAIKRDLPLGSRYQQRLEYIELARGRFLEVDATDGDGLIFESHKE
jgi:dihydroorotate dehydrogenase (fumarate)